MGQLVAELSAVLRPARFTNDWGQLDAAVWNWHPRQNQKGVFYVNPATGQHFGGAWERTLSTPDLAGFERYIVEFCTDSRAVKNYAPNDGDPHGYGFGHLLHETKDARIPARPKVTFPGPAGFPADRLEFVATPFESPVTNRLAAVQWRVGEIRAPGRPGFEPGRPWRYELEPVWTSDELADGRMTIRIPVKVCTPGHTYRVRARHKDRTGRWSHWSEPVEFVAEGKARI